MKRLLFLLLSAPLFLHAQDEKGIHWTTGLSWEQIKQKAKAENKYIFLDCFTTWCGPCKAMDKYVYTNDTIGQFFNINYISVRVQFDQTKNDNEDVKLLYPMVNELNERYVIEGYPSFLFFTPNGEAVAKESGYKEPIKFVKLADWALATDDRVEDVYAKYTRLIQEFKNGKINYAELPFMVTNAKKRGDTISREILRVHEDYVSKLPKKDRYTKENIEFWSTLNLTSDRKIVHFFYKDGRYIDKVIQKQGFSSNQLDKSIQNFIVAPFIDEQFKGPNTYGVTTIDTLTGVVVSGPTNRDEANWKRLEQLIHINFSSAVTKRNILKAKAIWYNKNSNWEPYVRVSFERFSISPPDLDDASERNNINRLAWTIFLQIKDQKLINEGIIWMEKLVQKKDRSDWIDTYANLLYKVGRIEEAIQWQEKAVNINANDKSYKKTLEQMRRGESTYGVQPIVKR